MTTLTFDQICRRAGGRRRYNLQRQRAVKSRRERVRELLARDGYKRQGAEARLAHGVQALIARELNVSEATISRDVAEIKLLAALEQLIEKMFPAELLSDDTDYDWSEGLAWDTSSTEAIPKRIRAMGALPDGRGGRRAGSGRKPKDSAVNLDAELHRLVGPYPTERQLNVFCQKLIEHALRGNLDALRVIMACSRE